MRINEDFNLKLHDDHNTIPRWIHILSSHLWQRKRIKTGYNTQYTDNYKMIARLFDIFDEIGFDSEMLKQFINGLSGQFSKVDIHKCIILYA